jgi:hypothetical protein
VRFSPPQSNPPRLLDCVHPYGPRIEQAQDGRIGHFTLSNGIPHYPERSGGLVVDSLLLMTAGVVVLGMTGSVSSLLNGALLTQLCHTSPLPFPLLAFQ